jgi:hypothetical protein
LPLTQDIVTYSMSPTGDVMVVLVALGCESLQPTTSRQHNQIQGFDPLWDQLSLPGGSSPGGMVVDLSLNLRCKTDVASAVRQ